MLPLETYFIKNNNYLLKQKISGKGVIILYFGSIQNSWIPITVPAFNIFQQIVLFEIYEEDLASCRYEMGKGRSISIFLDNWVIVF